MASLGWVSFPISFFLFTFHSCHCGPEPGRKERESGRGFDHRLEAAFSFSWGFQFSLSHPNKA